MLNSVPKKLFGLVLLCALFGCAQNVIQYNKSRAAKMPVDAEAYKADTSEERIVGAELSFNDVKTTLERACVGCHMPGKNHPHLSDDLQPNIASYYAVSANLESIRKVLVSQDFTKVMPRGDLSFKETMPGKKLIAWANEGLDLPKSNSQSEH